MPHQDKQLRSGTTLLVASALVVRNKVSSENARDSRGKYGANEKSFICASVCTRMDVSYVTLEPVQPQPHPPATQTPAVTHHHGLGLDVRLRGAYSSHQFARALPQVVPELRVPVGLRLMFRLRPCRNTRRLGSPSCSRGRR